MPLFIFSAIGSLVLALITYTKPSIAQFTAPLYCVVQGLFVGFFSAFAESIYPGIVINAMVLTFGLLFLMLYSYKTGFLRATPLVQKIVSFGFAAFLLLMLVHFISSFFSAGLPSLFESGPIGIGFSVALVALGCLCLILDFDEIERAIAARSSKDIEWVSAFGLIVTLIWLYIQALQLLMKLQSSDD